MASRNYQQPSAPPPPTYESVVNNNRNYPEGRAPDLSQFVNHYESTCFFQYIHHKS